MGIVNEIKLTRGVYIHKQEIEFEKVDSFNINELVKDNLHLYLKEIRKIRVEHF